MDPLLPHADAYFGMRQQHHFSSMFAVPLKVLSA
jgi:hypothetical protein